MFTNIVVHSLLISTRNKNNIALVQNILSFSYSLNIADGAADTSDGKRPF